MNSLTPDVKSILGRAAEIPLPQERDAFLDEACAGRPEVRAEVEDLLQALDKVGSFMAAPAAPAETRSYSPPIAEREGTVIGPYKLMELIGEGGFGLVFVAEQLQPVRRKVALKVIKPGMDTRQVVARFEAERQALALMDHPNIAKVHDAGTTDSGRPYFVMELVRGVPVTEYADANSLTPKDRLGLFIQVCQAVQHAHQKGVIHRDLKPTNILVAPHDGVPVVKVIDFGVAKALGQQLTEKTVYTRFTQMIGTPLYMSPEQAEVNQLDVDTRSDIYSLGVLLYELLTGTTPFDRQRFQKAAFDEIRRIIKEEEPPRPSTRLTSLGATLSAVSAKRGTDPGRLAGLVRGELDWIVMRALEKDRTRRYDTATALAKDVQRYLAGDAVEACPPSLGYRLRKTVRKHKAALAVAAGFVALLVSGIALTTWQAIRATNAEEDATAQRDVAVASEEKARDNEQVARMNEMQAKAARETLRHTLYVSDMNRAQHAWEASHIGQVQELLDAARPKDGEEDLRGFEWYYWDRMSHGELRTLKVDRDVTTRGPGTALNHDGNRLAVVTPGEAPENWVVKVWDVTAGRVMASVPCRSPFAPTVALSRSGQRLALRTTVTDLTPTGLAAARQKGIRFESRLTVWDVAARKMLRDIPVEGFTRIALNHDGSLVVAVPAVKEREVESSELSVWEVASGQVKAKIPCDSGEDFIFIGDGSTLGLVNTSAGGFGAANRKSTVRLLDATTGEEQRKLELPRLAQNRWDPAPEGPRTYESFATAISSGHALSDDGSRLVEMQQKSNDRSKARAIVWDVAAGKQLGTFAIFPAGKHLAAFSPDGKRLTIWSGDPNAFGQILNPVTGAVHKTLKGHIDHLLDGRFSADGHRLITVDAGGVVKEWDVKGDERPKQREFERFGPSEIHTRRSADGSRQLVFTWAPPQRKVSPEISVRDGAGKEILIFREHKATVGQVVLSADGRHVYSIDNDGLELVWESATGKVCLQQKWPTGDILRRMVLAPTPFFADGRRLVLVVPDGGVKVWELDGFRLVFSSSPNAYRPVVSPDGTQLLTAESNAEGKSAGNRTLWDLATGKARRAGLPDSRMWGVPTIAPMDLWSPDGRRLVLMTRSQPNNTPTIEADETLVIDTASGVDLFKLKSPTSARAVAFSADSRHLAAAGAGDERTTVRIWDATTGQVLLTLKGHAAPVTVVAFSPDGKRIATGAQQASSAPMEVKLWDAATGAEMLSLKDLDRFRGKMFFSPDGHRLLGLGATSGEREAVIADATPRAEPKQP